MVYEFKNSTSTLRRADHFAAALLTAADEITAGGSVDVRAEHVPIFPLMFGWWRFVNQSAKAFRHARKANFAAEIVVLNRNITDHTYAMVWLADVGTAGLEAVEGIQHNRNQGIYQDAVNYGWNIPANADPGPPPVDPSDSSDAAKRTRTLMGEIGSFQERAKHFGPPDMYTVYRHLSEFTHAGVTTADKYAEPVGNGKFQLRTTSRELGHADAIWITVSLIQAGHAISPMIVGDPLRKLLKQATNDMGLISPETISPTRRTKTKGPRPKAQRASPGA